MVIKEKGLARGVRIRLPYGAEYTIRKIKDDEVYVEGLRDRINIYGAIVVS